MKNLFLSLTIIFSYFFSGSLFAQQDSVYIDGPTSVCVGECATYVFFIDGQLAPFPVWTTDGTTTGGGNPFTVCFDFSGVSFITVFDEEFGVEASISVAVSDFNFTQIESNAPECQDFADEECETVCAGSSVTYTLPNAGTDVTWSVSGSDDYEIAGNSVTVNWDTPGTGSVYAASSGQPTSGLNINCGVYQNSGPNGGGVGYVYIEGLSGEYEIQMFSGPILISVSYGEEGLNLIPELQSGTYSVVILSADGQTVSCELFIPFDFECFLSVYPEQIQSNYACNGQCDGQITLGVNGSSAPFTYQWSNGSTTQDLNFACAGTYSVTVVDALSLIHI